MQMESEEDGMWYPEAREPYEDIEARGIEFLKWWLNLNIITCICIYALIFLFFLSIN